MSQHITLSQDDWDKTPEAVRATLNNLVNLLNQKKDDSELLSERLIKVQEHMLKPRKHMQVMIISPSVTFRQHKYALELRKLGWEVILACTDNSKCSDLSFYNKIFVCKNNDEYLNACLSFSPQIYHIFTSWEFEIPAFLLNSGIKPVVFDSYDVINGCVKTDAPNVPYRKLDLERYCLESSDAVSMRDGRIGVAKRRSGLKPRNMALCIDGACTEAEALAIRKSKRLDGIHVVYVGNMVNIDCTTNRSYHFELAKVLSNAKIHYHIYPSFELLYNSYKPIMDAYIAQHGTKGYVHMHKPIPANEIISEISQYHFGMDIITTSINRESDDHPLYSLEMSEYTLDNKIFDYISAGLFTFTYDAKWVNSVIERNSLGFKVRSLDEVAEKAIEFANHKFPQIPDRVTTNYWAKNLVKLYKKISS